MDEAAEQQPRIPGVKYRKVVRYRKQITVIDGVASTRLAPYDDWEPVPPREWDELILRGVTGIAITFTAVAIVGGTASIGGLLGPLVPSAIAYGMGSVFAVAWLYCIGIEWLNRTAPERARAAKIAGWFFLLLSMGAVYAYGHTLNAPWAGGFGACIDLVAKGSWWLLLREYAVPLDPDVAHWVNEQEQKLAGRALLTGRVRRLNRREAYQRAVGGVEYQAAGAILASAETARQSLPQAAPAPAQAPVVAQAPAPPVAPAVQFTKGPLVAPAAPAPAPPPAAPAPPAAAPAAPAAPQAAPADEQAGGGEEQDPAPPTDITRPGIAAICREAIKADPKVTDAALLASVLAYGHAKRSNLPDTVRRTAQRIDPSRKAS
ncbi:hypothetical protein ACFY0G_17495 [Streptomyces sp. NPDC001552]|uniref:hypothetical protein n=1 Tax=Streptomyces sp. NPDC001552 TaxID=3364587 RepID=UPI00369496E7